jgi:hypothetical protein
MVRPIERGLSRRRFLAAAATAAAAAVVPGSLGAQGQSNTPGDPSSASPALSAAPSPVDREGPSRRVLYRNGALATGRSRRLRKNVSILVEDGRIIWIRPTGGEEDPGPSGGLELVDASGATFVPGMVDCHAHITGPGGARWIERFADQPERLLRNTEHNGQLALAAGVRWLRDVGAPVDVDPQDGQRRALSLGIRDRWAGRRDRPYIRAAGTWLFAAGATPVDRGVQAENADQLLAAAMRQLDLGAPHQSYLDG